MTGSVTADGDPGDAFTVGFTTDGLTSARIYGSGAGYDPASGAITSIAYSLDYYLEPGNSDDIGIQGLVLVQGDASYTIVHTAFTGAASVWATVDGVNLTASDFSGAGATMPDFSTAGGPITIGFATYAYNNSGASLRFDNLSAVMTTENPPAAAPLPAALPLAMAGFGALAFTGRRRSRS